MPALLPLPPSPSRVGDPLNFVAESAAFLDAMPDLRNRLNHTVIGWRRPIEYNLAGQSVINIGGIPSGVTDLRLNFENCEGGIGAAVRVNLNPLGAGVGYAQQFGLKIQSLLSNSLSTFTPTATDGFSVLHEVSGYNTGKAHRGECRFMRTFGNRWVLSAKSAEWTVETRSFVPYAINDEYYNCGVCVLPSALTGITIISSSTFSKGTVGVFWK
jgi:hypothetical protein